MAVIKKKGGVFQKKKEDSEVEQLSLPKEPSVPSSSLGGHSLLIYGDKKIGKTTLASKFPKTFFMMLEPGARALSVYQRSVTDWKEFKGYVQLLKKDTFFETIVVDPVDLAYKLCLKYVCHKLVIDYPSDEEWGKGWDAVRDEFTTEINKLLHLSKGVILISHSVDKEIKTRTGIKYHKTMATLSGQADDILVGIVDIWSCYTYEEGARNLIIEGNDYIGAGHRLGDPPMSRFKYTDGSPIQKIPMGKSSIEAYTNFIKAFNNQLQKGGNTNTQVRKPILVKKH